VFRAVEFRKPLVIAANTGLSAWIDGDGRILAQGQRRTDEVVWAEVAPDGRKSLYLAYGDLPSYICLALSCVPAAVGAFDRLRRRRTGESQGGLSYNERS
jgi:apolipoprotein N-acyltransferase